MKQQQKQNGNDKDAGTGKPGSKDKQSSPATQGQDQQTSAKEVDDTVQGKKLENEDREGDATDTDINTR